MNTTLSQPHHQFSLQTRLRTPLFPHLPISARSVLILIAVCMALQTTAYVIILPLFARRFSDFGSGVQALGVSAMAFALTSTLSAPFMGAQADRFGRRPLVLLSLAAYILAFSGYLFVSSALGLILLRGLAGALTGGLVPAMIGFVADLAPAGRRAQWIGILNGGAALGWIVGPLLGGLLYDRFGYSLPFLLSILLAALAFLVALFLLPETHPPAAAGAGAAVAGSAGALAGIADPGRRLKTSFPHTIPIYLMLLWISFIVMFAWAFIEPQFMFYAYGDLGWTSSQLGLAMSAYGVTMMLGEILLGRWSDRSGRRPVLLLGLGLFISQFVGLAFFQNFAWIAFSFILAGFGNALYDPALCAYLLDISPSGRQARTMGIKSTLGSLGSVLGPALVVVFTPYLRPQHIFGLASILVSLTLLAALFFFNRRNPVSAY